MMMCCFIPEAIDYGAIPGHGHALLDTHVINKDGKTVRLVKTRNPWGGGEWKGDWGDESPLWTPELRQQVGSSVKEDGDAFMSIEDFHKFVRSYCWSMWND